VYAWKGLLDDNGVINNLLIWAHVIDTPIKMMYTSFSMMVGLVYTYLPFMILPLYSTLVKMNLTLLEAASDLGARPLTTFWLITVPLSKASWEYAQKAGAVVRAMTSRVIVRESRRGEV